MSTILGKRMRRTALSDDNKLPRKRADRSESPHFDADEIFQRHFEARFIPLPVIQQEATPENGDLDEESEEDSSWEGIESDEEDSVQVIEHTDTQSRMAAMSKEELKAFMISKPPKSSPMISLIRDKVGVAVNEEDASEAANLKKDLALQRLLAESHLLESSANPTLSGKNRHKATDLRIQALGSKTSVLKQEKMPMSHRKGITAKQNERERVRRMDAKENGVILEKAKVDPSKTSNRKRDRGVGAPAVGRFSGGTLTLSKKDIFHIEGPPKSSSSRAGRGGGRGKGRGGGK